ncbi:hypothetical protein LMG29660_07013 [Burkholderia puraquae]|uniref:Bacterial phospholipase C C-terminal domain-containing protein n=1 Tax=Burkholderia puraquae TaxID=1904757 RepID=A0A6J5EZ68_9BURK|nr:phospholipase domain-containing protein [Burkholderia puraquae]CAB3771890.1 hypothetical protein LMG29660_07013 [Burkholderia puraquae]
MTVVAPSGFVRRFSSSGSNASTQEATVCHEVTQGDLEITLTNSGKATVTFSITDNRYGLATQSMTAQTGRTIQGPWALAASERWYDISITCDTDARFPR